MSKICVLIRVYNRNEDLRHCVKIIRDTWKLNDYYLVIVSNGQNDGYLIDEQSKDLADVFIDVTENVGHFHGNSQLLLEGLKAVPGDCEYTILLEADTWLYGDQIISKYTTLLKNSGAVWASAQFFRYIANLATDFAIVNTSFLQNHLEILTFHGTPEYYVANYLKEKGFMYIYITENMPISMPRYVRKYPYAPTGRFFTFEKSKMVTHHIETLAGGMEEKQFFFNLVANVPYFKINSSRSYNVTRFKMRIFVALSYLIPYKSWFVKEKRS